MAGRPRMVVPGQALHVIWHGAGHQTDFFHEIHSHTEQQVLPAAADEYAGAVRVDVFLTNPRLPASEAKEMRPA